MDYLCSQWTPNAKNKFFMLDWSIYTFFVRNRGWKRETVQIMIFVHVCLTWIKVEQTRFETWITWNYVNVVSLFHHSYLLKLMAYLCSQRTPIALIMHCMFDWSIYRLFVLNTDWKHDSLQMMIFVNIYPTCSMFRHKTRFETSVTRNDINGVSLFDLSYLITLMAYLCLQWAPNAQIKNFVIDLC
jgi:hypothetical protein